MNIRTSLFLWFVFIVYFSEIAGAIIVNPGESIQAAIDSLPSEGGVVELAAGTHDVNDTIIINRSNIVIQGTYDSVIRVNNVSNEAFEIPHKDPRYDEPWASMPLVENLTFRGFKVTSSYPDWRGTRFILAYRVKNVTIEDILDESKSSDLLNVLGHWTQGIINYDIFFRNNVMSQSGFGIQFSSNIHVVNNIMKNVKVQSGVDINWGNKYVYIKNNSIFGGTNYNIRAHGGQYVYIDNNKLLGGTQNVIRDDGVRDVIISNNVMTGATFEAIRLEPQSAEPNITISNNLIYNNPGSGILTVVHQQGSAAANTDVDVINNVIYNNSGDGIRMTFEWVQLKNVSNNIIANNGGYGINYIPTRNPTTIKYNDVWGNALGNYNGTTNGTGDISLDPLFANPPSDFHLKSQFGRYTPTGWVTDSVTSPAIGAGEGGIETGAYGGTAEASKGPTMGKSYYVATYGDNANPGTLDTPKYNFSNTWFNSTNIKPGDTIYLIDGIWYNEKIVVPTSGNATHPITLTAYNGTPTLDGIDKTKNGIVVSDIGSGFTKNYITIDGIKILNYIVGILSREASHITISNNEVYNTTSQGVFFVDVNNSVIKNNHIHDTGWNALGIQINYYTSYNVSVINNTIHDSPGTSGAAGHNLIDLNNNHAGKVNYIRDINISNNHLYNAATASIFGHGEPYKLERIAVNNNIIHDVGSTRVSYFFNSTVSNNIIYNQNYGFYSEPNYGMIDTTFSNNNIFNIFSTEDTFISTILDYESYLFNERSRYVRLTRGKLIISDHLPGTFTVRTTYGNATIAVRYSDNKVFTENGANTTYYYPDRSEYTTIGDESVAITTYNMTASPDSGYARVDMNKFDTNPALPKGTILINITANTTDGNNVEFTTNNLKPHSKYLIKKNNINYTIVHANPAGEITFRNSIW